MDIDGSYITLYNLTYMNSTFDLRLNNIPQDLWLKIAQIEGFKGKWEGSAKLSPQILGRLKKSVLVTSTGSSTRIEGSKMSDEDIEQMLRGISIQKFSNRDEQEARGYYELLQNVFNSWQTLVFNENLIKHFHKELLKNVEKDVFPYQNETFDFVFSKSLIEHLMSPENFISESFRVLKKKGRNIFIDITLA